MYSLFYLGYLLFGGIGGVSTLVVGANALRKHEEKHIQQLHEAHVAGYWVGYGEAWPLAFHRGGVDMLQVCQSLAMESVDMAGANPEIQAAFDQLVASWPQFALQPQPTQSQGFPVCSSGTFLG